nr:zinc transporter ZIP2-like isoform X3 [Plodia interpunctella]
MPFYFAGLIMCGGFFMMYLIEELVHVYINSRQKKVAETDVPRPFSLRREFEESSSEEHVIDVKTPGHGHSHMMDDGDDSVMSALRGLLIVLALSIHELFEGLAVGLEASVGNVWYMFGAVSAHKYIIAFCIGVELLAAGTRRWLSLVYIFTFSFMSALGIGVGILMVGGAGAADAGIYSVVLQGLACGTLIYVVFFEVWRRNNSGLMQFTCAFLGFSVMVALGLGVELAI